MSLFVEQCLNGLQLGILLFLISAGLTLVFGIVNFVNLAHGSLFMLGAFCTAWLTSLMGSYLVAAVVSVVVLLVLGVALERLLLRRFYGGHHLDHVLVTFGLVLIANESARRLWGAQGLTVDLPSWLDLSVRVAPGVDYSLFKLLTIVVSLTAAVLLALLIQRTRLGMRIRAGAQDAEVTEGLGVDIRTLFTAVFGLGAALAGLAGALAVPVLSAQVGMGEDILILSFVVIVLGGVGSVKGSFMAALLVGIVDVLGRAYMPTLVGLFAEPRATSAIAASLSSTLIYFGMAVALLVRPQGLFAGRR
jgi:branched-chain amino acid transport system permease protein